MANFETLLQDLHSSASEIAAKVEEQDEAIVIDYSRNFIIPENFNTTIAYEGDINSQIITFKCPAKAEGHSLIDCQEKRLRWVNQSSHTEGSSRLIATNEGSDTMLLTWQAPPEAFVKSGALEISISFFDFTADKKIAYSWNTSILNALKVGKTLDSVSLLIAQEGQDYIPSKDEVLIINTDSRQITAPQNYNPIFCNYGDVNTSVIYFQVKRYIRGIDLLDEGTTFNIHWKIQDLSYTQSSANPDLVLSKDLYAAAIEDRDSEGLVNIIWKPNEILTKNSMYYFGKVIIQLEIVSNDERVWRTASYEGLQIGKSDFTVTVTTLPEQEGADQAYIIDGAITTSDKVVNSVAGLVKLRSFTQKRPIFVRANELVIENDDSGNYIGVRIGTVDYQDARTAPYVAYKPSTIIRVDGGDASGN